MNDAHGLKLNLISCRLWVLPQVSRGSFAETEIENETSEKEMQTETRIVRNDITTIVHVSTNSLVPFAILFVHPSRISKKRTNSLCRE